MHVMVITVDYHELLSDSTAWRICTGHFCNLPLHCNCSFMTFNNPIVVTPFFKGCYSCNNYIDTCKIMWYIWCYKKQNNKFVALTIN